VKRIMIFGSTGMAGHVVTTYLMSLNRYYVINIAHRFKLNDDTILLDVENKDKVKNIILDNSPEVIINCVGVLIKFSEHNPDEAIYINSYFPHYLERLGKENNIKIIHLSTDCVFSGKKGNYIENDLKDGEGFYAQSKALGEIVNDKDLTFRISIIGPELKGNGEGLFHWFMNQSGIINGYSKVFWSGITTLELAKAIDKAIEQDLVGLYHLTLGKKFSKFELLKLFKKVWKRSDIEILPSDIKKSDKSLIDTRKDFDFKVKDYEEMLNELYEWMIYHKDMYKNIYQFLKL